MSVHLRRTQACETDGCTRPARHHGLCSHCYRAATPAQRATCDLADQPTVSLDCLELLAALPAYAGVRRWVG